MNEPTVRPGGASGGFNPVNVRPLRTDGLDMPPAARLQSTATTEWLMSVIGHLGREVTKLAGIVGSHVQRIDLNLATQAEAVNDCIARLNNLEAQLADIERAIDEAE